MKKIFNVFLLFAFLFASCKKSEQHDASGNVVVKGTNRLIVSVMHHSNALSNIRVFLKNNATEFPGRDTTKYEWKTTSDNSGAALFENLFEGNYFLYAEGYDPSWGANVIGACPAVLNSTTLSGNEAYITLSVTE